MVDSKRRNACGLVAMSSPGSRKARMSRPSPKRQGVRRLVQRPQSRQSHRASIRTAVFGLLTIVLYQPRQ
jgi:hypothetical protein